MPSGTLVDVTGAMVGGVETVGGDVVEGEGVVVGAAEVRTEDVTAAGCDEVGDVASDVVAVAAAVVGAAKVDVDAAGALSLLQLAANRRSTPAAVPPRFLTMRHVIR
ncbi:MAG: hypothetical protein ABIR68_16025 [Ilumatobacteraceae bacterium]